VDIQKNARLTLREDLVQHVARGVTLKLAAANFNVTAKTVAKGASFSQPRHAQSVDRSSRPRRSPRRTSSSRAEESGTAALGPSLRNQMPHSSPAFAGEMGHRFPNPAV
jgi:hypothetical protein